MRITKRQLRRIIIEEVRRIREADEFGREGYGDHSGTVAQLRGIDMMNDQSAEFRDMERKYPLMFKLERSGQAGGGGYPTYTISGDIVVLKHWFTNWYSKGDPGSASDFDEFVEVIQTR